MMKMSPWHRFYNNLNIRSENAQEPMDLESGVAVATQANMPRKRSEPNQLIRYKKAQI